MLAFEIRVRTNNRLSAAAQRLVLPVQRIAHELAVMVRQRVLAGRDPEGNAWTPLGRQRMGTGRGSLEAVGTDNRKRHWWVSPTEPQPPGWLFIVPPTAKRMAGFAVYEDYATYLRATPGADRRDWYKTGTFWASVAVRPQSARRVKVIATGSRKAGGKRIANRDVGVYAGRREKFRVLTYSDAERAFVVDMLGRAINEQMAIRMQQVDELQSLTARAERHNKRASVLLGTGG